jgi:hypothetical protein
MYFTPNLSLFFFGIITLLLTIIKFIYLFAQQQPNRPSNTSNLTVQGKEYEVYVNCTYVEEHRILKLRNSWDVLPCSSVDVDIQLRTRQYIPRDSELYTRRCENLKSQNLIVFLNTLLTKVQLNDADENKVKRD